MLFFAELGDVALDDPITISGIVPMFAHCCRVISRVAERNAVWAMPLASTLASSLSLCNSKKEPATKVLVASG
jgi:hypothetical protein